MRIFNYDSTFASRLRAGGAERRPNEKRDMRSEIGALRRSVLALALTVVPIRVLATTADDLCAANANPCVVNRAVTVTDGSTIDVGSRTLQLASGGALDVGAGTMTVKAATLAIDGNGFLRALGTATSAGGTVNVMAGTVTINGTVDASGAPPGAINITATGNIGATGSISARALSRAAVGGAIQLTGGTANISGPVSVVGGFDSDGGDIGVDIAGNLSVNGTMDASGGDGGSVEFVVGTPPGAGNLMLGTASVLRADATTAGGFGGSVDVSAQGDGTATGKVTINGTLSATGRLGSTEIGGGSGGCVDVQGTGDVRVEGPSAKLTAEGGAPDGDGGEVDVTSDNAAVILGGRATSNVLGDESSGGSVSLDAAADASVSGTIDVTAGDGGAGEASVSSSRGTVTITKVGVVNAASTVAGEGGSICLEGRGPEGGPHAVLVEGTLSADGGTGASGGSIDLEGGDSVRVASTAIVHASGGPSGGRGGTVTLAADPGIVLVEAQLVAMGGNPGGPGGTISLDSAGRISVGGLLDGRGFGAGGHIGISADTGPIDVLSNVNASSTGGAGGVIELTARGDVRVSSTLTDAGTAPGGMITILGCNVTVCGLDSPLCPAGGVGELSSLGPMGLNRVTGRDSSAILGRLRANQGNGRNELVYDGNPDREPLVLGQVNPPAVITVDSSLLPCPACGNHVIEAPETCDDGNTNDGDGCSSTCQIEQSIPGDANGDSTVSADDLRAAIAEIFDGDGDGIAMVSGGSFPGSPGVDANGDSFVTAADITAIAKLLGH